MDGRLGPPGPPDCMNSAFWRHFGNLLSIYGLAVLHRCAPDCIRVGTAGAKPPHRRGSGNLGSPLGSPVLDFVAVADIKQFVQLLHSVALVVQIQNDTFIWSQLIGAGVIE